LQILHGVEAPQCEGLVIEVHLDMMDAPAAFLNRLIACGFENDPFLDFYPPGFHFHYTGRTRSLPESVHVALPPINELIADVMKDARNSGVKMYAECELVAISAISAAQRPARHLPSISLLWTVWLSANAIRINCRKPTCMSNSKPEPYPQRCVSSSSPGISIGFALPRRIAFLRKKSPLCRQAAFRTLNSSMSASLLIHSPPAPEYTSNKSSRWSGHLQTRRFLQ